MGAEQQGRSAEEVGGGPEETHGQEKHTCTVCQKDFRTNKGLLSHARQQHGWITPEGLIGSRWCPSCDMLWGSTDALSKHLTHGAKGCQQWWRRSRNDWQPTPRTAQKMRQEKREERQKARTQGERASVAGGVMRPPTQEQRKEQQEWWRM